MKDNNNVKIIKIAIEPLISDELANPAIILLGIKNGEDNGNMEVNELNLFPVPNVIEKNDK